MTTAAPQTNVFGRWQLLVRALDVRSAPLVMASALSLAGAVFEGLSAALLIPTLEGGLRGDFGFLRELGPVNAGLSALPDSWSEGDARLFGLLVLTIFLVVVLKLGSQLASSLVFDRFVLALKHRMRLLLMGRYMGFGKRFFDDRNAGQLKNLVLNHPMAITNVFGAARMAIYWGASLCAYMALMCFISWRLTLVIGILFPVLYLGLSSLIRQIQKASVRHAEVNREQHEHAFNLLVCMPLVKAVNHEQAELERFGKKSLELSRIDYDQARRRSLINPIQELILITAVLVIVGLAAYMIGAGQGTLSGFLVFFYLLRRSSTNFNDLNRLRGTFGSLTGILEESLEILDDRGKPFVVDGERTFQALEKEIRFEGLTFSYTPDKEILHGVSCAFVKGQTTAIVGRTGSGKTTLASLVLRFYEVPPGALTFDGVDVREFSIASLRDRMAYVSQDAYLLNDTIRANIVYGLKREVSDTEVMAVVREARLEELIGAQPAGLDARVGDRGLMVSGGEKQRIALARALLREPEILILDEATSSLDTRTERLVQEAIDACLEGRTAIVIAHRLSTIKNADKILLVEGGRVVEEGTLDQLLSKGGSFRAYWDAQHADAH